MPSRGVFSFEGAQLILPTEVTLEPHHRPARAFLERLADARSALVFNELLELELRETAFKIPLVERFPADWKKRRHDRRSLRRARRLVQETTDAWEDLLSAFTYLEVQVGETIGRVEDLMGRFGLSSYDAIHVATAEYAGAPTLITTDAGFASVPQSRLTIYTNASRVGPCRRMRRRT
jgi:predicted nucleic acid-binding protein